MEACRKMSDWFQSGCNCNRASLPSKHDLLAQQFPQAFNAGGQTATLIWQM